MRGELRSVIAMAALLVGSQLVALAVCGPFATAGFSAFQDPGDVSNTAIYIIAILAFTGVILALVKYRRKDIVRYVILGSVFITVAFVLLLPSYYALVGLVPAMDPNLAANLATVLGFLAAGLVTWILVKYPEWYVVDTVGLSTAAGVTAILGISFSVVPALLLLIALAFYDAWAVYRTKHMVTLADEVTSQRLPVLQVIPKHADYKFSEQKSLKEQVAKGEEREAMFIGLGDLIIPGVLAVSARVFLRDDIGLSVAGLAPSLLVALITILGSLVGFAILMRFVLKGNPQAGLPLLNGGAIAAFFLSLVLVYGTVVPPTVG